MLTPYPPQEVARHKKTIKNMKSGFFRTLLLPVSRAALRARTAGAQASRHVSAVSRSTLPILSAGRKCVTAIGMRVAVCHFVTRYPLPCPACPLSSPVSHLPPAIDTSCPRALHKSGNNRSKKEAEFRRFSEIEREVWLPVTCVFALGRSLHRAFPRTLVLTKQFALSAELPPAG